MKRFIAFLLAIVSAFCLSGCAFEGISLLYSENGEKDGFYIAVNETANCCFVGAYTCKEYTENIEITIPDEYDNKPVTRMGGYYGRGVPTPFLISVSDLYMNAPKGSPYNAIFQGDISDRSITDSYTTIELTFILNIGKNIKKIENVVMDSYYPHINEDGSITFYHPVVEIKCSEDNKYFYSKDGRLYSKDTEELIDVFEYAN